MATVGLMGQFFFPTTGITTKGQAMLLAIDDASLPLKRNLCIYMTKPEVRKEPVLAPRRGDPNAPDNLAAHFLGSVLLDQGKFRMWYYPCRLENPERPRPGLVVGPPCYAESDDGINWTRPNLGQVPINGSRDNNALSVAPGEKGTGVYVIRDDEDSDPKRRYKMIFETPWPDGRWAAFRTGVSPDGLVWTFAPDLAVPDTIEPASIVHYNGLYIVNGQMAVPSLDGRGRGRTGFVRVSTDYVHWLPEYAESFALLDPGTLHLPMEPGRRDEVHMGVGAVPFGNVLVGLYGLWHQDADFAKISCDLGLVVSNDGITYREPVKGYRWLTWQESPAEPVPDRQYPTVLCQGGGIVNFGDETLIFHGRWRNPGFPPPEGRYADYSGEVALATIPRDRWGALGLFPGTTEGSVWSCPVTLPEGGCEVVLNADGAREMRVEVADERFVPLASFSDREAGRPTRRNGLDCPVKWSKGDLKTLGGKTVRFRIHVNKTSDADPRLYAVYLRSTGE